MERTIKGLALEELEAHAHADLLPDRVEMHRRRNSRRRLKRVRSGNVTCTATNVAGDDVWADNHFVCQRINV
jgi:hypothetical protein